MRVYRCQTDDGERVIGRLVTFEALDRVYGDRGVAAGHGLLDEEAWRRDRAQGRDRFSRSA